MPTGAVLDLLIATGSHDFLLQTDILELLGLDLIAQLDRLVTKAIGMNRLLGNRVQRIEDEGDERQDSETTDHRATPASGG